MSSNQALNSADLVMLVVGLRLSLSTMQNLFPTLAIHRHDGDPDLPTSP